MSTNDPTISHRGSLCMNPLSRSDGLDVQDKKRPEGEARAPLHQPELDEGYQWFQQRRATITTCQREVTAIP